MSSLLERLTSIHEHHNGTILVVDDDEINRSSLSKVLEKIGYTIYQAENGQIAYDLLKEQPCDLVITDLIMPVADGRFLLKKIAKHYNHIPRIVLTGHESDEDILLALKTGAYDFIKKPILDYTLLNHSIQRALEKKWLQDERNKTISLMDHINQVITMLNRGKEIDEIFQMLSISLKEYIPFNKIVLIDLNHQDKNIKIRLTQSDREQTLASGQTIPISPRYFSLIERKKEIEIISSLNDFLSRYSIEPFTNSLINEGFNSAVLVPLIISSEVRGFLAFLSIHESSYKEEHKQLLSLLAGHIAFSLERGELLSELALHTKNLENIIKVRTHEVLKTQKTTIFALSKLAEVRDNETGKHLDRMRSYSLLLAQLLKYSGKYPQVSNDFLKNIYDSSILHDVGKVGIPDAVLLKPAELNHNEFEIMKTHTTIGYTALNEASEGLGQDSFLKMAKNIALYHHERWDGDGYPYKIRGAEIPLSARIVSICDVYDALTTIRPYKNALSQEEAIRMMEKEFYRFDPQILRIFFDNSDEFDTIRKQFS